MGWYGNVEFQSTEQLITITFSVPFHPSRFIHQSNFYSYSFISNVKNNYLYTYFTYVTFISVSCFISSALLNFPLSLQRGTPVHTFLYMAEILWTSFSFSICYPTVRHYLTARKDIRLSKGKDGNRANCAINFVARFVCSTGNYRKSHSLASANALNGRCLAIPSPLVVNVLFRPRVH